MRKLRIAAENPQQGWGPELNKNRHLFPALKELDSLNNLLYSFIKKDLATVDFESNSEKKKQIFQEFAEVRNLFEKLKELLNEYTPRKMSFLKKDIIGALQTRKISYLSYLISAKTFTQDHYQKMGHIVQAAKNILNIFVLARTMMPPERYQTGMSLLKELFNKLTSLQTLILKF